MTDSRYPTRKPLTLLAAVVVASGLIGGGTAALIAGSTPTPLPPAATVVIPTSSESGGSIAAVAAAATPSIVEITADSSSDESIGSGVVLTSDGTILTNNHVIADADTIKITFSNGNTAQAKVIGTDSSKDLAVIKAQGVSGLKPATLGNSDAVAIGDQVVAIGSPDGLAGTVTSGVVSALGRDVTVPAETGNSDSERSGDQWPFSFGGGQYNGQVGGNTTTYKAIQTDASLNPGNSGGALINMAGQVIGINSAMYSPTSSSQRYFSDSGTGGSVGLGFAIPVNTVKADLSGLENGSNT
jgi:putative serine protease PepD